MSYWKLGTANKIVIRHVRRGVVVTRYQAGRRLGAKRVPRKQLTNLVRYVVHKSRPLTTVKRISFRVVKDCVTYARLQKGRWVVYSRQCGKARPAITRSAVGFVRGFISIHGSRVVIRGKNAKGITKTVRKKISPKIISRIRAIVPKPQKLRNIIPLIPRRIPSSRRPRSSRSVRIQRKPCKHEKNHRLCKCRQRRVRRLRREGGGIRRFRIQRRIRQLRRFRKLRYTRRWTDKRRHRRYRRLTRINRIRKLRRLRRRLHRLRRVTRQRRSKTHFKLSRTRRVSKEVCRRHGGKKYTLPLSCFRLWRRGSRIFLKRRVRGHCKPVVTSYSRGSKRFSMLVRLAGKNLGRKQKIICYTGKRYIAVTRRGLRKYYGRKCAACKRSNSIY
eukprot:TRINITY_DN2571_c0_g1_i11.p1 TRINITY_DN2571_c0_g1~~TRINITY_DN2571_c0_g1_i11.p1  ORF type:complete len:387 (+),score=28.75 TRINITY_DN2571_c0_g1_i11:578-1738(+)